MIPFLQIKFLIFSADFCHPRKSIFVSAVVSIISAMYQLDSGKVDFDL